MESLAPPPVILNIARSMSLDPDIPLERLIAFLDEALGFDFPSGSRGALVLTFYIHLGISIRELHAIGLTALELYPDGHVSLADANVRWHETREARRARLYES